MRTARLLASLLPIFALACGGNVTSSDSSNSNQNQNQNHPQTKLPATSIAGSFDLTFTHVTATPMFSAAYTPQTTPPSQNGNARLDIGADSATSVTLTSRWGAPAAFPATSTATALTLDASTDVTGSISATFSGQESSGFSTTDRWTKITLGRTSGGGFDGTFTATGTEDIYEGDEGFENQLTATGTIAPDITAPEIRADKVPTDGFLPWDPTHVTFAEPPTLPEENLVSLDVGGVVTANASALQATLLLKSWDTTTANIAAKAVQDLAGNASTAATLPIRYLDVGTPKSAFTFDDTSAPVTLFATPVGAITQLPVDANCESGGCMKITTTSSLECANPAMGFAGVLQQKSGHANTLHVHYRMFVGVDPTSTNNATIEPEGDAFQIVTATPGVLAGGKNVGFALTDLKTVPSTYGFTQATDWTTVDLPIDTAAQAGFAIKLSPSSCGGGPIFNENAKTILIDSITVD